MSRIWIALALSVALAATPARAEKALCPVCHVMEGASNVETVRAERTHEGARYTFCSEKCAGKFVADPAAYLPTVFPRPAPALPPFDLNGKAISWESLQGKIVLVDFWATWCAPCRKAMPGLQALHEEYADSGFVVLGISIDDGDPENVKKYVTSKKITYPIALDDGKAPAWQRFRVKALPAAYLVDAEGRIVAQWTGAAAEPKDVEKKLRELL